MSTVDTVVDLDKYRRDKKFFNCSPAEGTIWVCKCDGQRFWLSGVGLQCCNCEHVVLFKDWEGFDK